MSTPEDIKADADAEDRENKYITAREIIAKDCGMTISENDDGDTLFTGTLEQWEQFAYNLNEYLTGNK